MSDFERQEFNKIYHITSLLNNLRFEVISNDIINFKRIYENQINFNVRLEAITDSYGNLNLINVVNKHSEELVCTIQDPFDFYCYFNCKGDINRAKNWKSELGTNQQYTNYSNNQNMIINNSVSMPTVDLAKYLKEKPLPYYINLQTTIPGYLIERMAKYLWDKHHIPISTSILVGLGVVSGFTCRKWNCAYEDGNTVPICLFVVAEQDSANGKSAVLSAFQKPFMDLIEKYIEKYTTLIAIKGQELCVHLDNEVNIEKKDLKKFKIQEKKIKIELSMLELKKDYANELIPTTDSTPQALEESLNDSEGFFMVVSDEQALLDSMISGRGNKSNQILLKGRYAERVKTKRRSRRGYDGIIVGNFVCFSQGGSIKKIINASNSTGLFERFLIIEEPESVNIDHTLEKPDGSDLLNEYAKKFEFIIDVVDKPLKYKDLITLQISKNGWWRIKLFQNELERLILPNQIFSYPSLKIMAKKVTYQIMSIASNLHLLESKNLPLLKGDHFIEDRFVDVAIELVRSLLRSTYDYFVRAGLIGNKDQLREVINYFIDKDGNYRNVRINKHTISQKKVFDNIKNKENLIEDIINFLISTNNLIQNQDGTHRLNPMVML